MKKILLFLSFLVLVGFLSAQPQSVFQSQEKNTLALFIKNLKNPQDFAEETKPLIKLQKFNNQYFEGVINLKRTLNGTTEIIGNDRVNPNATFFLVVEKDGNITGKYLSPNNKEAYTYSTDPISGNLVSKKEDISKHLCIDYKAETPSDKDYPYKPSKPVPVLESLPDAEAVLYLDFDGETSTSRWNGGRTIEAKSFDYSDEVIELHWKITAEDFRPFNVNVTTNRASFDKAPKNKRMLCIITPTKTAAPNAGGVAYLNSFSDGRDDPCWVFITDQTKGSGEVASHEIGHTLGLNHDGDDKGAYYLGHNDWGPIMGACHRLKTVHWSKGEYPKANNKEDDFQIIVKNNGFDFRKDAVGDDINSAEDLVVSPTGEVLAEKNHGIIEKPTDKDVFKIVASKSGKLEIKIEGFDHHPNLDVKARLLDENGTELMVYESDDAMTGELSSDVDKGTYFIEIDGMGKGNMTTGYGDYGSIGTYYISGKVPAGGGDLPKAVFSASKQQICAGQEILFKDESSGKPTAWAWKFENGTPATSDEQNPKVTYTVAGKHKVELKVTNTNGSDTSTEEDYIEVSEPKSLPVAEDFEETFPADGWMIDNPDNDITWEQSKDAGVDSKSCLIINNAEYSKVGEKDGLMLPEADFSDNNNDPVLTFFVAYTRFDEDSKDKLKVHISDDCGDYWDEVYAKEAQKLETKEVDFDESQEWVPSSVSDWRWETIELAKYKGKKSVKIKFENTTGYGNYIWIDNINIDFTSSSKLTSSLENSLSIAPNPTNGLFNIKFNATEKANYTISVRNILGETVYSNTLNNFNGLYNNTINLTGNAKGIYLLSIESKNGTTIKKIVKK